MINRRSISNSLNSRGGPLMIAMIFMMGTKYDCNDSYYGDWIWLQSSLQRGPNKIVMLVRKGTKYDWNLNSESDHIWLQYFSKRTKYDCNLENCPWVTWLLFLDGSCEKKSKIAIVFGPFWKRLQLYKVRFRTEITIIFSPFHNHHCIMQWIS